MQGGYLTFRSNTVIITGASNILLTFSLVNPLNNATYYVAIQNNGTSSLTINTGLGTNIKTTYSSAITVPTAGSALMTINILH